METASLAERELSFVVTALIAAHSTTRSTVMLRGEGGREGEREVESTKQEQDHSERDADLSGQ